MEELNKQVVGWFESGHMREALFGEGEYFLKDHTYRSSHAFMLVMYVLLHWANQNGSLESTGKQFEALLAAEASRSPEKCFAALVAYAIHGKDSRLKFPVDFSGVVDALSATDALSEEKLKDLSQMLDDLSAIKPRRIK